MLKRMGFLTLLTTIFTFQTTALPIHAASHAIQSFTQSAEQAQNTSSNQGEREPSKSDHHEGNCPLCTAFRAQADSSVMPIAFATPCLFSALFVLQYLNQVSAISISQPIARGPPARV